MLQLPTNDESVVFFKDYQKAEVYIPSVVAVLNKCGCGTLYFGVTPEGNAVGTSHSRNTVSMILKDFEENITPKIYPLLVTLPENKNVLKVMFAGTAKPYSYKSKYYIKEHNDIRILDYTSVMKELSFIDKDTFIEDQTINIPFWNIDDSLVKATYEKAISSNKYTTKDRFFSFRKALTNWGLAKSNNLTKAAILLYGKKSPLSLTLNFYDNEKKSNLIDTKFIKGNIITLLEFVLPTLKKTYCEKYKIRTSAYPEEVINEIVINAFMHANYNIGNEIKINVSPYKISVLNPGKFLDGYLPEDFYYAGARPIINNKLIAKVLSYEGYATLNGKGYKVLFETKKEEKPYLIKQNDNFFEFVYFIYTDKNKYLSIDKAVISILIEKPFAKAEDIAKKIGKTRRTVQTILKELKEKNLIVRKGSKKTGYWIVNK